MPFLSSFICLYTQCGYAHSYWWNIIKEILNRIVIMSHKRKKFLVNFLFFLSFIHFSPTSFWHLESFALDIVSLWKFSSSSSFFTPNILLTRPWEIHRIINGILMNLLGISIVNIVFFFLINKRRYRFDKSRINWQFYQKWNVLYCFAWNDQNVRVIFFLFTLNFACKIIMLGSCLGFFRKNCLNLLALKYTAALKTVMVSGTQ